MSLDHLAHPARILAFGHGEFEIEALAVGAHRQAGAVRKRDRAFLGREHDRHLVAPVLGELLEIAAGRYRRHAGDREAHLSRSIFCAASSMIAATSSKVSAPTSSRGTRCWSTWRRLPIARRTGPQPVRSTIPPTCTSPPTQTK